LLLADYASYIACQKKVEDAYRDQQQWVKKAILNVANMGKFSSDRTIMQYAEKIWGSNSLCQRTKQPPAKAGGFDCGLKVRIRVD